MKLYICTQDWENYGYRWKAKGCTEFVITVDGFNWDNASNDGRLNSVVKELAHFVEINDNQYMSQIVSHSAVEDDFVTDDEQFQLDEDGSITYPAIRKTYHQMLLWNM
jgi:hypothetical protein